MNGLQPFEGTIEQTTETMRPSNEATAAAARDDDKYNYKLTRTATISLYILPTNLAIP